jgi:hypothetical protein
MAVMRPRVAQLAAASEESTALARRLLVEALSVDYWVDSDALPLLAALEPEAVRRVRDIVWAHLEWDDGD